MVNGVVGCAILNRTDLSNGLIVSPVSQVYHNNGVSISLINYVQGRSGVYGVTNPENINDGLEISVINNQEQNAGLQIGLINYVKRNRGVQIGLVNVSNDSIFPLIKFW